MRENILNLPIHLRRQRSVTAEQAALAMAGVYNCERISELNRHSDEFNFATSYLRIIIHEVELGNIDCISRYRDICGTVIGAEFYSKDIWPWALQELSEPDCWYGVDNEHKSENSHSEAAVQWGEFAGKDTALLMIASLATAFEKAGGKYTRSNKLNKSAVISTAIKAVNDYGNGTELTDRALRGLIDKALAQYVPKLEE